MKKIIISIICLLSIFWTTNAFFWSPTWLDLYKNIDKWIVELEDKMIEFELNWWEENSWIINKINELSELEEIPKCLDEWKNISQKEFKKIISEDDINTIFTYIDKKCISESWSVQADILKNSLYLFKKYYSQSKEIAVTKTAQIYKLSNIWLYSDWMIENSWFDLITDIQEIDKIIFASINEYEWEEIESVSDFLNEQIKENPEDSSFPNQGWINNWDDEINNILENWKNDSNINNSNTSNSNKPITYQNIITNNPEYAEYSSIKITNNNYICSDNSSWLSIENSSSLLDNITNTLYWNTNWELENDLYINKSLISNINNTDGIWWNNNWWNWGWGWGWGWIPILKDTILTDFEGEYQKVIDNSEWPCETFFCIKIEDIMYQHNLFWWSENITIEYLLRRSNEHLRKYAATSLIPAKMSTDNFEIGLKDLNMPDIFHMWFQISTKPIPILNIEKVWAKDKSEFSSKNMLEKYYKANWLNYKRRNDLVLLKKMEQEKQSILNSQELKLLNAQNKQKEYYTKYLENEKKDISILKNSVQKSASSWILKTFEGQYIEIDKFSVWIHNYIENLYSIIQKMNEIPIDRG